MDSGQAGGSCGISRTEQTSPAVLATSSLPADLGNLVRLVGLQPDHLGRDIQRHRGHRQHPALGAEKPGHHVQTRHRIAKALPQSDNEQVPDCMIIQRAGAAEPILQDIGPGTARLVIATQRRQRHPEIAGRQAVQLPAKPTGGAAVVCDGDDRRQVVRNAAERSQ